MSLIKSPEGSVTLGAATGVFVVGIYTLSTPDLATVRATLPHDDAIESGRKRAAWTSAAFVSGVALLTKDPTVFVLGGAVLIALDWHTRHANIVHPETGKVVQPGSKAFAPVEERVPESSQGSESAPAPVGSSFAFG